MKNYEEIFDELFDSMCFVDVYAKCIEPLSFTYNAFFLGDSEHIVTHMQDFYEEAYKIEIRFHQDDSVIVPIETYHDDVTGITVFKIEKIEGVTPLVINRNDCIKENTECYIPEAMFYDSISELIPGEVVTVMDVDGQIIYQINHDIEFRELGCPLLNTEGEVIGIVIKEYAFRHWSDYQLDWQRQSNENASSNIGKYKLEEFGEKVPGSYGRVISSKHIPIINSTKK